ncbi:PCNA domain-containing protein [Actinidia rufa]|uniref:PCNA domain-containing protein n=1 Tax=Actinidia rufa TaxID=165716 RepID=A0A7J0FQ05_9ERIC|nr:PCNA domain-containing protein [Actinidia rufa]
MSTSATEPEAADLVCQLDNVQGMVDALTSVRWKRHQDAVVELSEHGIVLIVEESRCLQAKVYLQRENLLRLRQAPIDPSNIGVFNPQSSALKEAIDDLEWPGSSIQITLQPVPPSVTFRGDGHGDLQIDFKYYVNTDLLVAFHCDHQVSYRYKYKFLHATTSNIPTSVIKDNRGSKLTIGRGGMLKVQHLVSVARPSISHSHVDSLLATSNLVALLILSSLSSQRKMKPLEMIHRPSWNYSNLCAFLF